MEPTVNVENEQMPNVTEVLNNINFSEVIQKLTSNPEEVSSLIGQSSGLITPEMREQARKHAVGPQGEKIKEEMLKQGVNNKTMLTNAKAQKKLYDDMNNKAKGASQKAILITTSKLYKSKEIHPLILLTEAKRLIADDAIEISCSRLAIGNLEGKTIKAWYSPNRKGHNNLASLIVGFDIAGELLIVMEEGDLSENDIRNVKKLL